MGASKCICPGSFDPVTVGHLDIIRRAAALFDTVIVGVLHNPEKRGCFSVEKRVEMLRKACAGIPGVEVTAYDGLLAQLARELGVRAVVRGVRGFADWESEVTLARINHHLNDHLETLFLPATPGKGEVSATAVRQMAALGADFSAYVPPQVLPDIQAAFSHVNSNQRRGNHVVHQADDL